MVIEGKVVYMRNLGSRSTVCGEEHRLKTTQTDIHRISSDDESKICIVRDEAIQEIYGQADGRFRKVQSIEGQCLVAK